MSEPTYLKISSAVADFRRARQRADLQEILARLTGKSVDLLPYEEVRRKLNARTMSGRELKEIPLDAIVGSVGRYNDFTRDFLPRHDSDRERWARVKVAITEQGGLPPIEVYQIGEVYFVLDGNHRVSVARELGSKVIQAYVTRVRTKVPLSPDDDPDDLIIKAEYVEFLEITGLDELRPGAELQVTAPGKVQALLEHIDVHRYFMGLDQQRDIPYHEAVAHWYDEVYQPVVRVIRRRGVLRDFPERSETDLYLWLAEHRAALQDMLGWEVPPEAAAADLASQHGQRSRGVVARVGEKLREAVVPDELESGPPPGQWRLGVQAADREDCLFAGVLVGISGEEGGWAALEQALTVVQRESGRLNGLHVVDSEGDAEAESVQALGEAFAARCAAAGVEGRMAVEAGTVSRVLCDRARWVDLLIVPLAHPPGATPLARLSSGFRTLIQRCPRPVLATPGVSSPMNRALIAYDGSPKADEALFVATYLAGGWKIPLVVIVVDEGDQDPEKILSRARGYVESHGVTATYLSQEGPVAEHVLAAARDQVCDLIVMGGYGHNPVLGVVLGSAVDQVLRESDQPVLICR